jgi:hypothetical protein
MDDIYLTQHEPIKGYAPGGYTDRCCICGKLFVGDKRCVVCYECAKK